MVPKGGHEQAGCYANNKIYILFSANAARRPPYAVVVVVGNEIIKTKRYFDHIFVVFVVVVVVMIVVVGKCCAYMNFTIHSILKYSAFRWDTV